MSAHPHGGLENPDTAHEESDINVRAIIWFVAVLTIIVILTDAAMWGMFRVLAYYETKNDPAVSPLFIPAGRPLPAPGLQTQPWTDLKKFRADADQHLHSYGWVDEKTGVARIPIEKAKEMLLQKGIPVRPDVVDATEGTHVAAGGESNGGRTLPAGQPDKSSVAAPQAPASATPTTPGTPTTSTKPAVAPVKPGGGR
jgi:hypothetical protein